MATANWVICRCGQWNQVTDPGGRSRRSTCERCGARLKPPNSRRGAAAWLGMLSILVLGAAAAAYLLAPRYFVEAPSAPLAGSNPAEGPPPPAQAPPPAAVRPAPVETIVEPRDTAAPAKPADAPLAPAVTRLAGGRTAAARGKADIAIADFSEAIRLDPKFAEAYVARALAYERKGERDKARADFRALLELPARDEPSQARRILAEEWLSLLADPALPKPLAIRTGVIRKGKAGGLAPLEVETPAGTNYVLKMTNARTSSEAMLLYIRGGETFKTKVPLGTYKLRGAAGDIWYGATRLFGASTRYFKLERPSLGKVEAGATFTFSKNGRHLDGFVIHLNKQLGGNLRSEPIAADEFWAGDP